MVLYLRDCRRPYTSNRSHWIIKEIKPSSFFHELEKNNKKMLVSLDFFLFFIYYFAVCFKLFGELNPTRSHLQISLVYCIKIENLL